MAEIKITIENCNNISKGVISLEEEKLNIRYGMNGTGKSTLSTAISLFSQGKPMDDLKPLEVTMKLYLQLVLMGIFKVLEYLMKILLIIWFSRKVQ